MKNKRLNIRLTSVTL